MTAPERMPDKLLIKLVDNPNSVCHAMCINAAGGEEYTRTDIHQAALDRIAELEGAFTFYVNAENYRSTGGSWIEGDAGVTARAVLAKGDG